MRVYRCCYRPDTKSDGVAIVMRKTLEEAQTEGAARALFFAAADGCLDTAEVSFSHADVDVDVFEQARDMLDNAFVRVASGGLEHKESENRRQTTH